jgi:hypothetical protein
MIWLKGDKYTVSQSSDSECHSESIYRIKNNCKIKTCLSKINCLIVLVSFYNYFTF